MNRTTWSMIGGVAMVAAASMVAFRHPVVAVRSVPASSAQPSSGVTTSGSMNRDDIEEFLDTALPRQMEDEHIAGAAVARDGALLTARGYRQAVHLDRGDAAGRAGEARPRRRRQ